MERVNGASYAAVSAALGSQRLLEMAWSSRNLRVSGPGPTASATTFPAMVAANVALFTLPVVTRWRKPRPPRVIRSLAWAGLVTALGLRLAVISSLGKGWNVKGVVPNDLTVVRRGPYRWVRHPNYVAVVLEFAALPALAGGYGEAFVLSAANASVLWPRIRAEESLLNRFPAYRSAFNGVPRFIPRLRRQIPNNVSQSRTESLPKPQ